MANGYDHLWKSNWAECRRHYEQWWRREGLVLGGWHTYKLEKPHEVVPDPGPPKSPEQFYTDAKWRAAKTRYDLSYEAFPADYLPIAQTDIGPGSLGTFLGAEPGMTYETVWYEPCIKDPDTYGPIRFDRKNRWWRTHLAIIKEQLRLSNGNYFAGFPDIIENLDTLAALRGSEEVMMDLVMRPDWVKERLAEINRAFFESFDIMYDLIKLEDGASVFGPFRIWAPGKVAKVQCDASAMISPEMLAEFVAPYLREQCAWLDYSLYHLDGTQCIRHLDVLLGIEELDGIEWTPQYGAPRGGSPEWYAMYRRILAAGKCVQAIDVQAEEAVPLLDAVGGKGMFVGVEFTSRKQAEELMKKVEPYR